MMLPRKARKNQRKVCDTFTLNVPVTFYSLGTLNEYNTREIYIQLVKALNTSTKNAPLLDWPEQSLE